MRRTLTRPLLAASLGSLALLGAACGGSSAGGPGAAGTQGEAASAVPQTALAFVDANVDPGSDAWARADALGRRFPGYAEALAQVQRELAAGAGPGGGRSYARDVQPWLGGEAAVAVLGVSVTPSGGAEPNVVGFAQSKDDEKARAAITRDGTIVRTGTYKGYDVYGARSGDRKTAIAVGDGAVLAGSSTQSLDAAIDVRAGDAPALADLDRFKDALAKLPSDNLAVAYVDVPALAQLQALALGQARRQGVQTGVGPAQLSALTKQLNAVRGLAFSVDATDTGVHVRAVTLAKPGRGDDLGVGAATSDVLEPNVPANALAFLSFRDLGPALRRTLDQSAGGVPQLQGAITSLEQGLGLSLDNDLVPLLSGEHALYAAPGMPVDVGLLLHPADAAKGAATLRKLTGLLRMQSSGASVQPLAGGGEGEQVALGGQTVLWRRSGDVIGIGNDPRVGEKQASSIADSPLLKRLRDEAGAPSDANASAFVDVPALLRLALASGAGTVSASDRANLDHVGGFLAWAGRDGDTATADAFLEITK